MPERSGRVEGCVDFGDWGGAGGLATMVRCPYVGKHTHTPNLRFFIYLLGAGRDRRPLYVLGRGSEREGGFLCPAEGSFGPGLGLSSRRP